MRDYKSGEGWELFIGDCRASMIVGMADNSVDSIVCDPPYGINFMGKSWDRELIIEQTKARMSAKAQALNPNGTVRKNPRNAPSENAGAYDFSLKGMKHFQMWTEDWAREAFRVLKPGGHMLVFASPRTYHRMASGVEDAGFDVRDQIMWVFGSGFPKSHNLEGDREGWGTALKPAHEPIVMARKPFAGTVAANVLAHGTGAINIDGCRVGEFVNTTPSGVDRMNAKLAAEGYRPNSYPMGETIPNGAIGRWPANLLHDGSDEVLAAFPDAKGQQGSVGPQHGAKDSVNVFGDYGPHEQCDPRIELDKSAARFFYCAKTSKADRHAGMVNTTSIPHGSTLREIENATLDGNNHPTVKPNALMRYLCRLITPPGGTVLDPFTGSGSTGRAALQEGFKFIGCELSDEYADIAVARIGSVLECK